MNLLTKAPFFVMPFVIATSQITLADDTIPSLNLGFFSSEVATQASADSQEQAVGFYSEGSLVNASFIPWEGEGFLKIFRPRNRHFSSLDLVEILQDATASLARAYPQGERIQIGDMSAEKGGQLTGHGSHQNGLDVDVTYLRNDHREQDPENTRGFDEKFVKKNGETTSNFDMERNWSWIKILVESKRINRVFVDAGIKKALCDHAKQTGEFTPTLEALRRLRPWPEHDDHMHIRISCPPGSTRCVSQPDPPAENECPL